MVDVCHVNKCSLIYNIFDNIIVFVFCAMYIEDGNGLEGTVPTELGNLQSSKTLWLSKF